MAGFPSCPQLSLTIHHFQDTNAISSPGSSFPSLGNRKFSQPYGNRAHYPHPSSNSPTNFSLGNPTWWFFWLCPYYSTNGLWLTEPRRSGSREHTLHQAASGLLEGRPISPSKELLQLQEEMSTALEELLEVRASMDCHYRELDLRQNWLHVIIMPSLPRPRHTMQLQLLPATGSSRLHLSMELQRDGGGGAKIPSFCKEVLRSPLSLSIGGLWGTHVPPTTLDWQHSLSPPHRDVSCSLTTGHDRQRIHTSTSCLECVGHSSASNQY